MNKKFNLTMKPKTVAILLVALLSLIILIQNSKAVIFQLLFWRITIPLVILILLVFVAGFMLGYVSIRQYDKRRKRGY